MSAVKFSLNMDGLNKKLAKIAAFKGAEFEPEVTNYARRALVTSHQRTPVRSYWLIYRNQQIQYYNRVNYIPSIHWLADPSLRPKSEKVKDGGWAIYCGGKWYSSKWKLPPHVFAAFNSLMAERERRLRTEEKKFINDRAQARFLYKKSWTQAAESLGVSLSTSGNVKKSVTRRKPPEDPARAYARRFSRDSSYTISISNPFLEQHSEYKPFSGIAIFHSAAVRHQRVFMREVSRKLRQLCKSL
jgi:hypothetical protein